MPKTYVFPGLRKFIVDAIMAHSGGDVRLSDVENLPAIKRASLAMAQIGTTSGPPASLATQAISALEHLAVAIAAVDAAISDLIEHGIISPEEDPRPVRGGA